MKSFRQKADFRKEKNAWTCLQTNTGMVQYLGDYTQKLEVANDTGAVATPFNIILEFGEHDLDDVFNTAAPLDPDIIKDFWTSLFEVAKALKGIHFFTDGRHNWRGFVYAWILIYQILTSTQVACRHQAC
jgi:hypothetical protein